LSFLPNSFQFKAVNLTQTKNDKVAGSPIDRAHLVERLQDLQIGLDKQQEDDENHIKSTRPIKPLKKKQPPSFSLQPLPPFAGSPKGPPILSTVKFSPINIPPPPSPPPPPPELQIEDEEDMLHQDTTAIKENTANCLITDEQDRLFYELEQLSPIPAWHRLKMLNLSRQNLTNINNLSSCFPVLEYLQV
jgi:hypothetical protein